MSRVQHLTVEITQTEMAFSELQYWDAPATTAKEADLKEPERPPDEGERLATLRSLDILDTPPEERFDRLTRMARKLFEVPIALVSLVDGDRQWFKSRAGLEAPETPRSISFCGHAILGSETFSIPDATQDERFADNPLVVNDPNIRFYAGVPLRALNGNMMGTLCIIDQQPRDISEDDLNTLRDLAAMAEGELSAMQLATLDELTGLTNRRGFMVLAQYSLNLCARQEIPASLIFIDLDGFKEINDEFGHAEGDRALMVFAEQMKHTFRESDLFARLGGDEFVALLTNTSPELAEEILARFKTAIDEHNRAADGGYEISFSHGSVAFDPEKHLAVGDILAAGDALMYTSKRRRSAEADDQNG